MSNAGIFTYFPLKSILQEAPYPLILPITPYLIFNLHTKCHHSTATWQSIGIGKTYLYTTTPVSKTLNPKALNGITDYYDKNMLLNFISIAKS